MGQERDMREWVCGYGAQGEERGTREYVCSYGV